MKHSLLSAYISDHKFNIICLFETCRISESPSGDYNFKKPEYRFRSEDHPFNSQLGESLFTIKTYYYLKLLTLYCIILKNGQTYFKNLAV